MNGTQKGWTIFVAAIGSMAGLMAVEVRELQTWSEVATPGFVGGLLAHFAVVVGAFVGGKLLPQAGD